MIACAETLKNTLFRRSFKSGCQWALHLMHLPEVMVCNAVMSAGMAHLAGLVEGGMSHRDAVAKVFQD